MESNFVNKDNLVRKKQLSDAEMNERIKRDMRKLLYKSMQMIAFRLPSGLVLEVKRIAAIKEIGYQSLVLDILEEYVNNYNFKNNSKDNR